MSNDINVITAEINAYKQMAGEAIFEIGRRLKEVRDNPGKFGLPAGKDGKIAHGEWEKWLKTVDIPKTTAWQFIQAYEQLGGNVRTFERIGISKIIQIISLPTEINRQQFIEKPHTIPSTGEVKTVDEMTVRELREKERNMREIVGKAYTELGRELKEAQDRLAGNNQYDGVFEK